MCTLLLAIPACTLCLLPSYVSLLNLKYVCFQHGCAYEARCFQHTGMCFARISTCIYIFVHEYESCMAIVHMSVYMYMSCSSCKLVYVRTCTICTCVVIR